jgi:TPR repeat protein
MKLNAVLTPLLASLVAAACSTTPGDAANRSNHPQQAAELYRRGADQGDALAARKLAFLIEEHSELSAEFGTMGTWFLKGCDVGDLPSCHNVGVGYETSKFGLSQNYDQARIYYQKAADHGYMQSQYNLGTLYSNQYFNDDTEGLKWLLASQRSAKTCATVPLCKWILDDPPSHVAKLKGRMTTAAIAAAESQSLTVRIAPLQ